MEKQPAFMIFDQWRIFPRFLILLYVFGLAYIIVWFTGLAKPLAEQTTFCSIYTGLAPLILGIYVNGGGTGNTQKE